jgi:TolB-like protein/DNA-binding winged helix-turn-helix (wHTH) protein/Tfp pilus assembly protein PilF
MDSSGLKPGVLRFGAFELDPARGELRKAGELVKLQSQQIDLLTLLARRPGEVVSREEIRRALWDEGTFVDFDQSINFCVNKVREALGDDSQKPRFIETVPRKGYRFIAPLVESGPAPAAIPNPAPRRRWWLLGAAAVVTLAAIALAAKLIAPGDRGAKPIESLAVLPLENLSHDPDQDYFADGMTDELITDLAKISALRVLSRTSVMQYKKTKKPVPEIARELNVDAVLEGTVTRDQGRVRITAQLIRAAPEKHLWAERYEGTLNDVLTMQDAVAKAVAREIRIQVTPQEQARLKAPRAVDSEAHEAYLKGRYLSERPTEGNLVRSREYLERAVAKDPSYALAWAGVANTHSKLASWGVVPTRESAQRARAAAEKALELDNSLVEPLVTLAGVKMNYEWDWAGAEQLFKKAIALNPRDGSAHGVYAGYLAEVGRTQEAVAEARRAHEVEPLDFVYGTNIVWKLYLARQYEQALAEIHKQSDWEPARGYIVDSVYMKTGREHEAVADLRKCAADPQRGALELMFLAHALGVTGAKADGRKVLEQMQSLGRYIPPEYIAVVYEGLGDRERAIQWFEKAYAEHSMNGWLLPDPRLDSIRTDPRFRNILRRMGLPQ